ncbi:MAG: xanthine dehydrogenase family protein molybdopterin-binding subunit [Aestuariivita sp.]|nr:xanthine dehydrogenase family protein molybdopterin-binding subunit [Aestuariivita sp.]
MSNLESENNIGKPIPRKEDAKFLQGNGLYTDDIREPGQVFAVAVRSSHAAGRLVNLDTKDARFAPGVITVLTGNDYRNDGLGPLLCTSLPPKFVQNKPNLGEFFPISKDRVNCVGDIVAIVIANTQRDARDAAELVSYEIEEIPPVVSIDDALQNTSHVVPGTTNLAFLSELGDRKALNKVFNSATQIIKKSIKVPRIVACAMEPRAVHADYSTRDNRIKLTTSTQSPHRLKQALALLFKRFESDFQVVAPDVGGGFGSKGNLSPEEVLMCWVALKLQRPVSWCPFRSESFISDFHGRDMQGKARLAINDNLKVIGADFDIVYNMGFAVGPSGGVSPLLCSRMVQGVYDIPVVCSRVRGVLSNLRPTTSYRGAGRPEATYLIEAAMDHAARTLGVDTVDFRRQHLISAEKMPYQTKLFDCYDSGNFPKTLSIAEREFDEVKLDQSCFVAGKNNRLLGRGVSNYVEVCGVFSERMEIAIDATGNVRITAGTLAHGQGHETVFAQMVSDWLSMPLEDIYLVQGDTDQVHFGRGTWGSRSISIGGSALKNATDALLQRATRLAAFYLNVPDNDIRYDSGHFSATRTNDKLSIQEVARMSYSRPDTPMDIGLGLEGVGYFNASPQNYPSGCHMVELEINPDTGQVKILKYVCVDDVGRIINPLLLDGQIQGGFSQALGEVFSEEAIYDLNGQLLTSSFMDYGIPKAIHVPRILTLFNNSLTETNPLGAKGGAEVGIVGGVSALMLALRDALDPLGISEIPMPATPARLWSLINESKSAHKSV